MARQWNSAEFERMCSDPTITEYYRDIFGGSLVNFNEVIVVWENRFRKAVRLKAFLSDEKRNEILGSFYQTDLYFTPNTYFYHAGLKPVVSKSEENRILVFGIDIDYKKNSAYKNFPPEKMFEMLMDQYSDLFPVPNWIEYGNQLRLIYILEQPLIKKNGPALYKGLQTVVRRLCRNLNNAADCHAEPQKAWYRVPGSRNAKNDVLVRVRHISSEKFTVQYYMDEWLPDLPYSKQEYEKKKKERAAELKAAGIKKKRRRKAAWGTDCLQKRRIHDYEVLAATCADIPRETLIKLYGIAWYWIYKDDSALMDELLHFNRMLIDPLPIKEVQSKFRTLADLMKEKWYKYSNDTIMSELGLEDEDCESLGIDLRRTTYREHKSSIVKRQERMAVVEKYYDLGYSAAEIAEIANCSVRTVRYDIQKIKRARKYKPDKAISRKAEKVIEELMQAMMNAEENEWDAIRQKLEQMSVSSGAAPKRMPFPLLE